MHVTAGFVELVEGEWFRTESHNTAVAHFAKLEAFTSLHTRVMVELSSKKPTAEKELHEVLKPTNTLMAPNMDVALYKPANSKANVRLLMAAGFKQEDVMKLAGHRRDANDPIALQFMREIRGEASATP